MSFDLNQLDFTSSIEEIVQINHWELYPAVSNGEISIKLSSGATKGDIPFLITNTFGAVIRSGIINTETTDIDVSDIGSGYFYFSIIESKGISTKKFLIK
jgi:hypothetical protein